MKESLQFLHNRLKILLLTTVALLGVAGIAAAQDLATAQDAGAFHNPALVGHSAASASGRGCRMLTSGGGAGRLT